MQLIRHKTPPNGWASLKNSEAALALRSDFNRTINALSLKRLTSLPANPDGDLKVKVNGVPVLKNKLVQLLVVLQLGVAVEQEDGVVLIGQTLFVKRLQVGGQIVDTEAEKGHEKCTKVIHIYEFFVGGYAGQIIGCSVGSLLL